MLRLPSRCQKIRRDKVTSDPQASEKVRQVGLCGNEIPLSWIDIRVPISYRQQILPDSLTAISY